MFKEIENLAAQAGFRFAEAVKVGEQWFVILDDEDGEVSYTGDTIEAALEKTKECLLRVLNRHDR